MKIAITGAEGFIGSYLIQKLSRIKNMEIFVFDKKNSSLLDIESMKNFVKAKDVIIHLAGIKGIYDLREMSKINVFGTENLLKAVIKHGKNDAHFLFASSFLVYNEKYNGYKLREDDNCHLPENSYGLTKLMAENIIKLYTQLHPLKSTILRIANVYGPVMGGRSHSVPNLFIEAAENNETLEVKGDGSLTRDLIYIDDVINGFEKAIFNQKKKHLTLNICTGRAIKISKLIRIIEKCYHKKVKVHYDLTYQESACFIGDNKAAAREIGFKSRYNLLRGTEETIKWYQKNKK